MMVHLGNDNCSQSWVFSVERPKDVMKGDFFDSWLDLAIKKFSVHCRDVVEAGAINMDKFYLINSDEEYFVVK